LDQGSILTPSDQPPLPIAPSHPKPSAWARISTPMFGFLKREDPKDQPKGPRVSTKFAGPTFNGKYPHVGLYDTADRKIWVCKPLAGQAIRTSHARLITGADNATSTVWKD